MLNFLIDHKALLAVGTMIGIAIPFANNETAPETSVTHAKAESDKDSARYEVIFVPSWNPATNPYEYPITHGKKGLLTPAIGASHNENFTIFCAGKMPTPGLERLSEMGKHDPLDKELSEARSAGKVGDIIRFADGSPGPVHPPVGTSIMVREAFSKVSLVGMIAPSPDWFYGVSSVELRRDGAWVPSLSVPAYAWDSGGDGGTTYMAEDRDLERKQATKRATSKHFRRNGQVCPVGYFLFKQIPSKS